jgi:hypothetical protein
MASPGGIGSPSAWARMTLPRAATLVRAQERLGGAVRGHVRGAVGRHDRHEAALRREARVVAGRTEVRAAPDRDEPDAVLGGKLGRDPDGADADRGAERVPGVQPEQRAAALPHGQAFGPPRQPGPQPAQIHRGAPDAVRLRAPQVGFDERLGHRRRVGAVQAGAGEAAADERGQVGGGDEPERQGPSASRRARAWI